MTAKESYFVGTNTTPHHVEEALHQGIIGADERLLGIFDGIFFDEANSRVGGLALNDFLVITDRRLITWARDQFKDFVDYFPLSHVFVVGQKDKDSLHGTLSIAMALPDVPNNMVAQAQKLALTFDFMPILDLKLAYDLIEVMSNLNRDMLAGGAGEADRIKAASVLFEKVFVKRSGPGKASAARPQNGGNARSPYSNSAAKGYAGTHYSSNEPLFEIVQGAALDDMMTPLHRLDRLDDFNPPTPARQSGYNYTPPPPASNYREDESRLWSENGEMRQEPVNPYSGGRQSRFRQATSPNTARSESEVGDNGGAERLAGAPKPPGVRLREDMAVGTPEGLYTIGRAGRAAWDGLEKLRREAEAKSGNLVPMLQNLRDSGMNIHDMTEFLTALTNLLDTLGSSPAAFELARTFISRSGGQNPHAAPAARAEQPKRAAKGPVRVEEEGEETPVSANLDEDVPTADTGTDGGGIVSLFGNGAKRKRLRVERRNSSPLVPEVDPAEVAPVRQRVKIRSSQADDTAGAADSGGNVPANDEIMLLFSKVDAPPRDGFDGLSDLLFDDELPNEVKDKQDSEATTGGFMAENIRHQVVRSVPGGPELN